MRGVSEFRRHNTHKNIVSAPAKSSMFLTETEISDVNVRHFLSPTGNTTDQISKPKEELSTKKSHQDTFASLLAMPAGTDRRSR